MIKGATRCIFQACIEGMDAWRTVNGVERVAKQLGVASLPIAVYTQHTACRAFTPPAMDSVVSRTIPLHLAMFAVIGTDNAPLYVHSYTGEADALRYHHLAHASLDIFEEREADPERAADNYVGLMFSMDDLVLWVGAGAGPAKRAR